ncbi:PEP-CTERM sorting domain-containing protein [Pseudorhodoferax sp.]|uniref:PEP-CTERM sorting domain-containing protein n=1 Tax=Pseudorhodoferax sp. TaxID=1993553 RepID=UPI002DD6A674|nr:PEP-CTERM sorting domain-containing protein [Pseudorhodoferax sp.]
MSFPLSSSALRRSAHRLALASALALPALAGAAPVVLDFDHLTGVDYMPGTPVGPSSRLADQYLASHGVRFSSGAGYAALVDLGTNHAASGRIGVGGTTAGGGLAYNGVELRVSFFDLLDGSAGVTDYFSWTTDRLGDSRDLTLMAYDVDGALIAQQTWVDRGWTQIALSVQNMHSVVFIGKGAAGLDDLRFNAVTRPGGEVPAEVPEPASAALLGAGLGLLWWRGRRRNA